MVIREFGCLKCKIRKTESQAIMKTLNTPEEPEDKSDLELELEKEDKANESKLDLDKIRAAMIADEDNFFTKLVKENRRILALRDSPEFEIILDKVLKVVDERGAVNNEGVLYFPKEYPYTKDEYNDIFKVLDDVKNEDEWQNYKCKFPAVYRIIERRGNKYEFIMMFGQGTRMIIRKMIE